MVRQYDENAWNRHIPQLKEEFRPCLFDGERLVQDCGASSPSSEELVWFRKALNKLEVKRVLDLGCGIGLFAGLFDGLDYTGVDLTPSMVAAAKEKVPDKRFVVAAGGSLGEVFRGNRFDLVWTRAVIQHNAEPDKSEIIRSIREVLSPSGYYMFHEHQFLDDGDVETYMKRLGFALLEHPYEFSFLFQKQD